MGRSEIAILDNSSEGALLGCKAISEGFNEKEALIQELRQIGYPENSISSMLRCGKDTGYKYASHCDDCFDTNVINSKHKCNLRTCSFCSRRRKNRIKNDYLPALEKLSNKDRNSLYKTYFMTISPHIYQNLEEGLKDIAEGFKQFRNANYVKERLIGGIAVIETTYSVQGSPYFDKSGNIKGFHNKTGWHVHLHIIIYSRRLDNQIRGYCIDCHQNLIKYDYERSKYLCANQKCKSENIKDIKDSRIVKIAQRAFNRKCNVHITDKYYDRYTGDFKYTWKNPEFCLNYMLKYISTDKFEGDLEAKAIYIKAIYNQNLLIKFGSFVNTKNRKSILEFEHKKIYHCKNCKSENVGFINDMEVVYLLECPIPPPDKKEDLSQYWEAHFT